MKLSYRTKSYISLSLMLLGFFCIIVRIYDVASDPSSGRAWWDLFAISIMTFCCYDNFKTYRKKITDNQK